MTNEPKTQLEKVKLPTEIESILTLQQQIAICAVEIKDLVSWLLKLERDAQPDNERTDQTDKLMKSVITLRGVERTLVGDGRLDK